MKMKFKSQKQQGFTLIELFVIIAILGMVSVSMLTNYRGVQKDQDVYDAASEILSVLRRAQSSALSGALHNGALVDDYRVHFSETSKSYILCADSADCTSNVVETLNLPSKVQIADISIQDRQNISKVDVIFPLPFASAYFDANGVTGEKSKALNIILRNEANTCSLILVDPISGKISSNKGKYISGQCN